MRRAGTPYPHLVLARYRGHVAEATPAVAQAEGIGIDGFLPLAGGILQLLVLLFYDGLVLNADYLHQRLRAFLQGTLTVDADDFHG